MTRQEAVELLRELSNFVATTPETDEALNMAIEALEQKPKRGKWIDYTDEGFVECPFCHSATTCEDNIDELKFCFSCGARNGE